MKKLGLLLITVALTLGAFVMAALPAAAHTGSITASQDCNTYTVTAVLDANVSNSEVEVTVLGTSVYFDASDDGPKTLGPFTGSAPVTGNAVLTIDDGGSVKTYTAQLVPATNCNTPCPTVTETVTTTATKTITETTAVPTTTTATATTTTTAAGTTVTETLPGSTVTETLPGETVTETVTIVEEGEKKVVTRTIVIKKNGNTKTINPPKGGTAFTGPENVVPIGLGVLALLSTGTGLMWASRRKRDE